MSWGVESGGVDLQGFDKIVFYGLNSGYKGIYDNSLRYTSVFIYVSVYVSYFTIKCF